MKKYFFTIIFMIFSLLSLSAEKLTGLWESNFGASKESVMLMMQNKGWSVKNQSENSIHFKNKDGTYGGLYASDIIFLFENNKYYSVEITVSALTDNLTEVIAVLKDKYNCILKESSRNYSRGYNINKYVYSAEGGNEIMIEIAPVEMFSAATFTLSDVSAKKKITSKKYNDL